METDFTRFLNSHKNHLFRIAQRSNIDFSRFQHTSNKNYFTISIVDTPLKFIVEQAIKDPKRLRYQHSLYQPPHFPLGSIKPAERMSLFSLSDDSTQSWYYIDMVGMEFESWIRDVVEKYLELVELASAPDLWSEFENIQPFLSSKLAFDETDFETFTDREKEQIRSALLEFKKQMQEEFASFHEELNSVNIKIDYLINAVNRLNRFDWKGVALSTVVGIATNLSVDTTLGKRVLDLFQQAFGTVIRFLPE